MKSGFDVCLHNKRLDMLVPSAIDGSSVAKETKSSAPKHPSPQATYWPSLKVQSHVNCNVPGTLIQIVAHLVVVAHVSLTILSFESWQLGIIVPNVVLFVGPCLFSWEWSLEVRTHILTLHLAAVYALVMDVTKTHNLSISFYLAAFVILSMQMSTPTVNMDSCKPGVDMSSRIMTSIPWFIKAVTICGIALQTALKIGGMEWETGLDFCLVTTTVVAYVSSHLVRCLHR